MIGCGVVLDVGRLATIEHLAANRADDDVLDSAIGIYAFTQLLN